MSKDQFDGIQFTGGNTDIVGKQADDVYNDITTRVQQQQQTSTMGYDNPISKYAGGGDVVASKLIDKLNEKIKAVADTAEAKSVYIPISDLFSGVAITLIRGTVKYSQFVLIDKRPAKDLASFINDAKTAKVVLAAALLDNTYGQYISDYTRSSADMVKLDPVVAFADELVNEAFLDTYSTNLLLRMDAKSFTTLANEVNKLKNKRLTGQFASIGQSVSVHMYQQQEINADTLFTAQGNDLTVNARVEPMKAVVQEHEGNMIKTVSKISPTVFIKAYSASNPLSRYSLEYGLISIIAATTLLTKDKTYSALLPTKSENIGALNMIFQVMVDNKNAPIIELPDLPAKLEFMNRIITDASLGIDLAYRSELNAFNNVGVLADNNAMEIEKNAAETSIIRAYKNLTGSEYQGGITTAVIQYPTGTVTLRDGSTKDISDIDAIWLASRKLYVEADLWLNSDLSATGLSEKLDILNGIAVTQGMDVKVRAIGYKIILDDKFVNALVQRSGIQIYTNSVLEIPNNNPIPMGRAVSAITSAGYGAVTRNSAYNIIGL